MFSFFKNEDIAWIDAVEKSTNRSKDIESRNWLQQSAGPVKVVMSCYSWRVSVFSSLACLFANVLLLYKKGHAECKCVDLAAYCTVGFEWVKTFWRSLCYIYCGRLRKFPSVCAEYDRREQESTISASADWIDHIQAICVLPDPYAHRRQSVLCARTCCFESHSFVALVCVVFLVRFTFICVHSSRAWDVIVAIHTGLPVYSPELLNHFFQSLE